MSKDDGGPAFAVKEVNDDGTAYINHLGMSLRDYFAGQALAGIAVNPGAAGSLDELASAAYLMADSMIAERNKEKTP